MYGVNSELVSSVAFLILVITLVVFLFFCRKKPKYIQMIMGVMTLTVLIYSGIGIAYSEVDNTYIIHYAIFLVSLLLPFSFIKKDALFSNEYSSFDLYIVKNRNTIESLSTIYLLLLLLPCLLPSFKLGNILNFFSAGNLVDIFDTYADVRGDTLYKICITLSMFLLPFFYIHLFFLVDKGKEWAAAGLIVVQMLLTFCPSSYLGRGKLMMYALLMLFVLFPPVKNGKFVKKTFVVVGAFVAASIPILYAFMFLRLGETVEAMTYKNTVDNLFRGESYYPTFYDQILMKNPSPDGIITMLLWIICLPIPSLIWPSKPVIDKLAFTFSITGLQMGDRGFSILLPSALGESFQFCGPYLFWVYALIVGCVYALFSNFFIKHKTLSIAFLHIIIGCMELGRSGISAVVPTLINGNIALLIMYYFFLKNKRTRIKLSIKI